METKKVWSAYGRWRGGRTGNLFMFEMESKFPLNVNSKVCSLRTQMQSLHRFLTGPRIYGFNFHLSAPLWIPAPQMENQMKFKMKMEQFLWLCQFLNNSPKVPSKFIPSILVSCIRIINWLKNWYVMIFYILSEHSLSTYFSQVLIYFPLSRRGRARSADQVWALISQLWRWEKYWTWSIKTGLLPIAGNSASELLLKRFTLHLNEGGRKNNFWFCLWSVVSGMI